jgi:hypothetical protein
VARGDLRRRRARIALLIVLVGAIGAVTMATAAGARRASTALERFQASSLGADIELSVGGSPATASVVEQVPGVEAAGYLTVVALILPQLPQFQSLGVPTDTQFGTVIDRGRIVDGRAPDPNAVDEVALGEGIAAQLGLSAGDTLQAVSYTPEQVERVNNAVDPGPPAGPAPVLRVTAIVRRPLDLGEEQSAGSLLIFTPAFARQYAGKIGEFGTRVRIRTVGGQADVPDVLQGARERLGEQFLDAQALDLKQQGASKTIDVLAAALWIAAAAAAVAGIVAIGIVLSRETALAVLDRVCLGELGCTRREQLLVTLPATVVVALVGAAVATLGAILLSPLFPVGAARRADPDIGVHVDWVVVAIGVAALTAVVLTVAFLAAARALDPPPASHSTRRRLTDGATRVGGSPAVASGVRMAVDPDRGRSAIPVRAGFLGAIAGIVGVSAVLVFAASLDQFASVPARHGAQWDVSVPESPNAGTCYGDTHGLETDAAFAALAEICTEAIQIDGTPVNALAFRQLRGEIEPVLLRGRAPEQPDEVALGARTLQSLNKDIGDTVEARLLKKQRRYTIVGEAVMPTLGAAQPLGEGAIFTGAGHQALFDRGIYFRYFVGRLADGADRDALAAHVEAAPEFDPLASPAIPVEVGRLQRIGWLPWALALLFAALGSIAVAHALLTNVRRRRKELALLKALGFRPRDVRVSVASTATTLAAVGLVVGAPVGALIGVLIWRRVTNDLGVATTSAIPVLALAGMVVAALVVVNAIAFVPGRRAARTPAAHTLQAE